jgi:hypothetical protein
MNATAAIRLIVKLWHDDCPDDPSIDDWKVYSFNRRHHNNAQPGDVGFVEDDDGLLVIGPDLQAKLKSGLAFQLSYYEHGQCAWSLSGEGPQCRWDSVRFAGLMVWEQDEGNMGAKSYEDRRKDAQQFIERYTQWCNGEVYGYHIEAVKNCCACGSTVDAEDECDLDLPSCGGYYPDGIEGMVADMKEHIGDDWQSFDVTFEEQHPYGLADRCKALWKGKTDDDA